MANEREQIKPGDIQTLDIPADGAKQRTGFALDIGGSMVKLVYTTDEGSTIRLHFVSYPRDETRTAVANLKEKMAGKMEPGTTVYTCGVGLRDWTEMLNSELNISIANTSEMDCFIRAFCHMTKTVPPKQLFYPQSSDVKAWTAKLLGQMQEAFAKFTEQGAEHDTWDILERKQDKEDTTGENSSATSRDRPAEDSGKNKDGVETEPEFKEVEYPTLLCMLGSGGAMMQVNADGSHTILEGLTRCGRSFVGVGKLLTGAKSYQELLDLAAKGDFEKLHIIGKHLKREGGGDVYDAIMDDMLMYSFGHAVDKLQDTFTREDLAAAWLNHVASDIAQTCHLTAMAHDIRSLYLCGGFVGLSQLVREHIATWLDFRCTVNPKNIQYEYQFLRVGGYYGALGALLKTLGMDKPVTITTKM